MIVIVFQEFERRNDVFDEFPNDFLILQFDGNFVTELKHHINDVTV